MSGQDSRTWDVAVVGAGMAGMSAALFAASRGLSVLHVGNGGGLLFTSGLLDVLSVHPVAPGRVWDAPWDAMVALKRDEPGHPLVRVGLDGMRASMEALMAALSEAGMPYAPVADRNREVPTSLGTTRMTYGVPRSMVAGADALSGEVPTLLVDFRGLREFSAYQIVQTLGDRWPGLRCKHVGFPGTAALSELYAVHLATALESSPMRDRVLELVLPLLGDARAVGFPAVLGLSRSGDVHAAFEAALGMPVFEIPTMPTSAPGLRLKGALEAAVGAKGAQRRVQAVVTGIAFDDAVARLTLSDEAGGEAVHARSVILATGRFMGRGLLADRNGVVEPVLGLPVEQPASRDDWHSRRFLEPAGHAINRAGLVTDPVGRPVDASGKPAWHRLFAVGSILARQDWMRQKCGAGLSAGTAWAAVDAIAGDLGTPRPAAG